MDTYAIIVLETDNLRILESKKSLFSSIIEDNSYHWYVLDGVQRLATLYNVLSDKAGKLHFSFNLDNERFIASIKATKASDYVDLHDLYSPVRFLEIQRKIRDSKKYELYFARVSKLYDAFKDYEVPIQVISEVPLADAVSIFERMNVSGQHLSKSDIERIQRRKK